jgi:hypothetical protein
LSAAAGADLRRAFASADLGLRAAACANCGASAAGTRTELSAGPNLRAASALRDITNLDITARADARAYVRSPEAWPAAGASDTWPRDGCGAAADLARRAATGERDTPTGAAAGFSLCPRRAELPPRVHLSPGRKAISLCYLPNAGHLTTARQVAGVRYERAVGTLANSISAAWASVAGAIITWAAVSAARPTGTAGTTIAITRAPITGAAITRSPTAGATIAGSSVITRTPVAWASATRSAGTASQITVTATIPVGVMPIELAAPVIVPIVAVTVMPAVIRE